MGILLCLHLDVGSHSKITITVLFCLECVIPVLHFRGGVPLRGASQNIMLTVEELWDRSSFFFMALLLHAFAGTLSWHFHSYTASYALALS